MIHHEGHELQIAKGQALLINPGPIINVTSQRIEYLAISLAPAFVIECAAHAQMIRVESIITFNAPVISHIIRDDQRLNALVREMLDEIYSNEMGKERALGSMIELLILHLLRRYAKIKYAPDLELSRVGLVDRRIRRAIELMHAHLEENLSVNRLAASAYLSPFHFSRLFKKLTGTSPYAYLGVLRCERAKTLLADRNLSITEISMRVGYSSPSHFTKAFRAATGMTPREFRQALIT